MRPHRFRYKLRAPRCGMGIVAGRSTQSLAVMWVFDGFDDQGKRNYFEIDNTLMSRGAAFRFVASIPVVEIIKKPKFWSFADDEISCVFRRGEKILEICEPYGDNSRFHIGANPPVWCTELETVRDAFARRGSFKRRRIHDS